MGNGEGRKQEEIDGGERAEIERASEEEGKGDSTSINEEEGKLTSNNAVNVSVNLQDQAIHIHITEWLCNKFIKR